MEEITIKDMLKLFSQFDYSRAFSAIFSDWIELSALAIQNSVMSGEVAEIREKKYMELANRYSPSELKRFGDLLGMLAMILEDHKEDVLGKLYMQGDQGSGRLGQFFTPYHLSQLTAGLYDIPDDGDIVVEEPSCGGGGMIIALAERLEKKGIDYQRRMKVTCRDLDWRCIHMAYVQLSLLGIDAVVIQGDTLGNEEPKPEQIFYTPKHIGVI